MGAQQCRVCFPRINAVISALYCRNTTRLLTQVEPGLHRRAKQVGRRLFLFTGQG